METTVNTRPICRFEEKNDVHSSTAPSLKYTLYTLHRLLHLDRKHPIKLEHLQHTAKKSLFKSLQCATVTDRPRCVEH